MDFVTIVKELWDKGPWCLFCVAIIVAIRKIALWMKPHLEELFAYHKSLVTSLESTTKQQAEANERHAAANEQHAAAHQVSHRKLDELLTKN